MRLAVRALLLTAFLLASSLPLLADSSGEHAPTQTSGDLANGANALACNDGLSATYTASNQQQIYSVYGFSVPPAAQITGIQVHLRALNDGTARNRKLRASLSWNAGVTYTSELQTRNLGINYRDYFLGGSTYLWGRTWSVSEVSNANLRVKIVARNLGGGAGSGNVQLDCVPVTVFYEIPGAPSLSVAKTANPDPVQPLQNLTYTITYANTGASTATNVIVTDTVPANTTFVSASPAGQVLSAPAVGGSGVVTWNVGSVGVGGSGAVTLVVKVNAGLANGSQILNSAYDIKSDQNTAPTAGNQVATTVQGNILLSLSKTDFPDPVGAGATLTYVLTITNNSATTPSTGIIVSEGFDPNVTYNSYTSTGCGTLTFDAANFTWTIGSLAAVSTCQITITTTVGSPLSAGVLLVNLVDLIDDAGNTASASAITTVGSCGGSPNGTPCDDGNACTQADTCQSGSCVGGNPVVCTAADQCHEVGTCNTTTGICSNPAKPSGSTCSDGNACTSNDTCQSGNCVGGSPTNCNDGNQCTDDSCNPLSGCANSPVQNGIACGNTDICDGIETCQSGQCTAGSALNCNDGNSCTVDACDAVRGCVQSAIPGCCNSNADCADSSACTVNERCVDHACTSDARSCDDSNSCTSDSCNPDSGCAHTPVSNNTACDDSNVCNGINTCQNGVCNPGTAPNCDDDNSCTADACNAQTGCTHQATPGCCSTDADCADNTLCTVNERCVAGQCVSDALNCDDASPCTTDRCDSAGGCVHNPVPNGEGCADTDVCNGIERCQSGSCTPGTALNCNDSNGCTTDSCDAASGCHNIALSACCSVDADCADSSACTTNERCVEGSCTSDPVDCDDTNVCTSDSCNPSSGCVHTALLDGSNCSDVDICNGIETCRSGNCTPGTTLNCNDANSCTNDSCDSATGCHNPGIPGCCTTDADCADASACTMNERCQSGSCTSDPVDCNDENICTADSCNPVGGCVHTNLLDGANCSDGDTCNGAETCREGACAPATPLSCNDGSDCTTDSCDALAGCHNVPIPSCCTSDADCADSSACTTNERCVSGACTSDPLPCDDGEACTTDSCSPSTGCLHTAMPNGQACGDANLCNGIETCQAGRCAAGVAPNCNDGNPCTTDACDLNSGCTHASQSGCCFTDADCVDGDQCTVNERCIAGSCTSDVRNCNDANPCTDDSCNPGAGCSNTPLVDSTSCSNGNACDGLETCVGGICRMGTPPDCDDRNFCTMDTCDNTDGCRHTAVPTCCNNDNECSDADLCTVEERCTAQHVCTSDARNCDDANVCTADSCNPGSGCVHSPLAQGSCDDGSLCAVGDACRAGACAGTPTDCSDGNRCNGAETCNPADGQCNLAVNDIPMCAPGSRKWVKTCSAQWYIANPNNLLGVTESRQWCKQGDATCDFDASAATCTFHVAVCFRVPDPRLVPGCTLSNVTQFSLLGPSAKKDAPTFNSLMTALLALPGAAHGTKTRDVLFTPALSTVVCTNEVPVTVPVGKSKKVRGKTVTANAAKDTDGIKFKCLP